MSWPGRPGSPNSPSAAWHRQQPPRLPFDPIHDEADLAVIPPTAGQGLECTQCLVEGRGAAIPARAAYAVSGIGEPRPISRQALPPQLGEVAGQTTAEGRIKLGGQFRIAAGRGEGKDLIAREKPVCRSGLLDIGQRLDLSVSLCR
jgi:hypothetical protein